MNVKHEKFDESNEIFKIIALMKIFSKSGLYSFSQKNGPFGTFFPLPGALHPIYGPRTRQSPPLEKMDGDTLVEGIMGEW
jgi:hypothetical protein